MNQVSTPHIHQEGIPPEKVGPDDGLGDICHHEGPLENLGDGMGPECGDGGSISSNQQLTVGGMALVPTGCRQYGQLQPSVHKVQ